MENIGLVISVVALFLLRVGIPVILLVGLGILIDRWQRHREEEVKQHSTRKPAA